MLHVHAVDKKKQVDDICDRCNSDMPGIKQAANLLEKEFANQGLLTHKRWTHGGRGFSPENRNNYGGCPAFRTWKMVDPKETGWSPRNRDNYGGSPSRALELIDHIATVGFSPHDMEHTTFEQVKPGSTETQTFNENLAEGDMASAPASPAIKYGSVAGSHTCAAVRAIRARVPNTSTYVRSFVQKTVALALRSWRSKTLFMPGMPLTGCLLRCLELRAAARTQ